MKRRNSIKRIQKMKSRKRLKKMKGGMNQNKPRPETSQEVINQPITASPYPPGTQDDLLAQAAVRKEEININQQAAINLNSSNGTRQANGAAAAGRTTGATGATGTNGAGGGNAAAIAAAAGRTTGATGATGATGTNGTNGTNPPTEDVSTSSNVDRVARDAQTNQLLLAAGGAAAGAGGGNRGNGSAQTNGSSTQTNPPTSSNLARVAGADQTNAPPLASGQSATTPVPSAAAEQISRTMKLMKLSKTLKKLTDCCTNDSVDVDEKRQVLNLSIKIMDSASTAENITASASKIHDDLDSKPPFTNDDVSILIGLLLKSKSQNGTIISKFGKGINIDGVFDKLKQFTSMNNLLKDKYVINNYKTFEDESLRNLGLKPIDIIKLISLITHKYPDKKIKVEGNDSIDQIGSVLGDFGYLSLDRNTISVMLRVTDNKKEFLRNSKTTKEIRKKHILLIMSNIFKGIYTPDFKPHMNEWIDNIKYSSYFKYFENPTNSVIESLNIYTKSLEKYYDLEDQLVLITQLENVDKVEKNAETKAKKEIQERKETEAAEKAAEKTRKAAEREAERARKSEATRASNPKRVGQEPPPQPD